MPGHFFCKLGNINDCYCNFFVFELSNLKNLLTSSFFTNFSLFVLTKSLLMKMCTKSQ